MIDFLYALDLAVFHFINGTLATRVGDFLWPIITDYDKQWFLRIPLVAIWLWLIIKGGSRGRTVALMLIPLIAISDQFTSSFVKPLVGRLRPCQAFSPDQIHLIVGCGGLSFPSSHAVNNFGVATVFSQYYPKWRVWFYAWATVIAISRVAVGVHYPSDVIAGAVIGTSIALLLILIWKTLSKKFFPSFVVT
jgi:undecaprenyl-diphosphatase